MRQLSFEARNLFILFTGGLIIGLLHFCLDICYAFIKGILSSTSPNYVFKIIASSRYRTIYIVSKVDTITLAYWRNFAGHMIQLHELAKSAMVILLVYQTRNILKRYTSTFSFECAETSFIIIHNYAGLEGFIIHNRTEGFDIPLNIYKIII